MTDIVTLLRQRPSDVSEFYSRNMENAAVEIERLRESISFYQNIFETAYRPAGDVRSD